MVLEAVSAADDWRKRLQKLLPPPQTGADVALPTPLSLPAQLASQVRTAGETQLDSRRRKATCAHRRTVPQNMMGEAEAFQEGKDDEKEARQRNRLLWQRIGSFEVAHRSLTCVTWNDVQLEQATERRGCKCDCERRWTDKKERSESREQS